MNEQMNRKIEQARRLTGQPVCVVLNDGSYYIGTIKGMQNGQLLLAGKKGQGRMRTSKGSKGKAKVSGLFSMLGGGGLLGGAATGAGAGSAAGAAGAAGGGLLGSFGGLGGIMGFMKQAWPIVQMGMGMVKQIMPLMSMFKK
ncbi:hypothetical protein [Cohnella yongneupensis]|uniref:Uncharacterized protein n=1 Tax=Cohnella yongneupensis TaxID=425006 RepID=A0ABW0QYX9_9BACL